MDFLSSFGDVRGDENLVLKRTKTPIGSSPVLQKSESLGDCLETPLTRALTPIKFTHSRRGLQSGACAAEKIVAAEMASTFSSKKNDSECEGFTPCAKVVPRKNNSAVKSKSPFVKNDSKHDCDGSSEDDESGIRSENDKSIDSARQRRRWKSSSPRPDATLFADKDSFPPPTSLLSEKKIMSDPRSGGEGRRSPFVKERVGLHKKSLRRKDGIEKIDKVIAKSSEEVENTSAEYLDPDPKLPQYGFDSLSDKPALSERSEFFKSSTPKKITRAVPKPYQVYWDADPEDDERRVRENLPKKDKKAFIAWRARLCPYADILEGASPELLVDPSSLWVFSSPENLVAVGIHDRRDNSFKSLNEAEAGYAELSGY
jgi:hypothetical protein